MDTPNAFAKGVMMPKTRPPYASEFRCQMVELVRAGRDPDDLAREFEPTAQSIRAWVAKADKQEGRQEGVVAALGPSDREALARLRREVRQLRMERNIRSKAAAWFARESGAETSASSNSSERNRPCSRSPPWRACSACSGRVSTRGGTVRTVHASSRQTHRSP